MTKALFALCTLFGSLQFVTLQEVYHTSNYRVLYDPKGGNFSHHAERCKGKLNLEVYKPSTFHISVCEGAKIKFFEKYSQL